MITNALSMSQTHLFYGPLDCLGLPRWAGTCTHACMHTQYNHFMALLDFVCDYSGELAPEM